MASKKIRAGNALSFPIGIAWGLIANIIITLLGAAVIAYAMVSQKITEDAIGYTSMTVLAIAAFSGAALACIQIKKMRIQVSLISGGIYYLFLLLCGVLFFDGVKSGMLTTAVVILLSSISVSFLSMIPKSKSKLKLNKHAYR